LLLADRLARPVDPAVIPAKAGIHLALSYESQIKLDPRLRGDDAAFE
jgi:hypothetical protein